MDPSCGYCDGNPSRPDATRVPRDEACVAPNFAGACRAVVGLSAGGVLLGRDRHRIICYVSGRIKVDDLASGHSPTPGGVAVVRALPPSPAPEGLARVVLAKQDDVLGDVDGTAVWIRAPHVQLRTVQRVRANGARDLP